MEALVTSATRTYIQMVYQATKFLPFQKNIVVT